MTKRIKSLIILLNFLTLTCIFGTASCRAGRAVSLRAIQNRLKNCPNINECPDEIRFLGGLKKIAGYVLDEAHNDIILFGTTDDDSPPIYLEDFIIALRNTKNTYAERTGNTIIYSHPGCSIDPDEKTTQKLHELSVKMQSSEGDAETDALFAQWDNICSSPQTVRVMGVPFDSRFAWIMVKADYDMKSIADGNDDLQIDGFSSLTAIRKNEVLQKREQSFSLMMNRFWFFPGKNLYLENPGIIKIVKCPVILLSEQEYLNSKGKITGTGFANPLARYFAEEFSKSYSLIAKKRPIYSELENLFVLTALAKILDYRNAFEQSNFDPSFFIHSCQISSTFVERSLPGKSNIENFGYEYQTGNSIFSVNFIFRSCGGVTIEINIKKEDFQKDDSLGLNQLKASIINAQKAPDSISWDFHHEGFKESIKSIENNFRLDDLSIQDLLKLKSTI